MITCCDRTAASDDIAAASGVDAETGKCEWVAPGNGHFVMLERADEVNKLLGDFLATWSSEIEQSRYSATRRHVMVSAAIPSGGGTAVSTRRSGPSNLKFRRRI